MTLFVLSFSVGAEDVGLTVEDIDLIFKKTRFVTCISPELGECHFLGS